jgi:peroxin-3
MKASNEEKLQAWEQMKRQAFIRTISATYCVVLIVLFLRVEVNILGRYLFLDNTTPPNNEEEEQPITQETQKKYLDFSEYIRGEGLQELTEYISKRVEEELVNWPLAKMYTFEDLMTMIAKIRMRVEGPPRDTEDPNLIPRMNVFYQFLLPAEDTNITDKQLVCLLNETRDVLESNHFEHVLQVCLAKGFSIVSEHLREAFNAALASSQIASKLVDSLPMPKIIPLVKKEFDTILETTPKSPTEPSFAHIISSMKDLEEYSYYIFTSSYDES